ncbi:hypothetical protein DFH28DRAFT_918395 [Melampsora americana]|nr:hypothetical protein DFH28DRAFT_918395 [Melampsora americana]
MAIIVRGPVSRSELLLRLAFGDCFFSDIGRCNKICEACYALHWDNKRTKQFQGTNIYKYSNCCQNCCQSGKVKLPSFYFSQKPTPDIIVWLMTSMEPGKPTSLPHYS